MTDRMTPRQRSYCMSRIRGKNTKPEMLVRRFLWQHGIHYRLHKRGMPGTPDIVLRRLRTVIFINGCFWHGHSCQDRMPKTNADFWHRKIERNKLRDIENGITLRNQGWNVITIWECELTPYRREETLRLLLNTLESFDAYRRMAAPGIKRESHYPRYDEYPAVAAEPDEEYRAPGEV